MGFGQNREPFTYADQVKLGGFLNNHYVNSIPAATKIGEGGCLRAKRVLTKSVNPHPILVIKTKSGEGGICIVPVLSVNPHPILVIKTKSGEGGI